MSFRLPIFMKLVYDWQHFIRCLAPKLTYTGHWTWKEQIEMYLLPKVKFGFLCTDFHKTHTHSIQDCGLLYENVRQYGSKSEKYCKIYFTCFSKMCLKCTDFHETHNCFKAFLKCRMPKFFQIGKETCQIMIEYYLCSSAEYKTRQIDFGQTQFF